MSTINHKFVAVIEATENPMAPIILQEAYSGVSKTGKLFASISNKEMVATITERLLKDFPDKEIDKLCSTPEFIMSLCGLLSQSLLSYGRGL